MDVIQPTAELVEFDEQCEFCLFAVALAFRIAASEREGAGVDPFPILPETLDINICQDGLHNCLWLAFDPELGGGIFDPLRPAEELDFVEREALPQRSNKDVERGVEVSKVTRFASGLLSCKRWECAR